MVKTREYSLKNKIYIKGESLKVKRMYQNIYESLMDVYILPTQFISSNDYRECSIPRIIKLKELSNICI